MGGADPFVYVLMGKHGSLKVGYSSHPPERLSSLQSSHYRGLQILGMWRTPHADYVEGRAQYLLRQYRAHSHEWFDCDPMIAFEAVMAAMRERPLPARPKVTHPAIVDPGNLQPIGYARDYCEAPITEQRTWLRSIPRLTRIEEDRGVYDPVLWRTIDRLEEGECLCVFSRAVFRDPRIAQEVEAAAHDRFAVVRYGRE